MTQAGAEQRRHWEGVDRPALERGQLERFNQLLATILPANRFYSEKLAGRTAPLDSLDRLAELPFTTKEELLVGERPDHLPANLTYSMDEYVRFHQTSGTRGRPMAVWDTADDWQWLIDAWQYVLDAAVIEPADRAMMAFSFGPFLGFWSAFDAVVARGAMVVPGGGMTTLARLALLERTRVTALFCTPTYALHVAQVAEENAIRLAALDVRCIVVAGEPGGSVPAMKKRIEDAWGAKVIDHAGASEVGPWGYSDAEARGLHIIESEFIAEFLSVETGRPAAEGELAHLVLTTLGRTGCPVIRYRTGDLVRPCWSTTGKNHFVLLEGGVLGRADDMLIVRGVNIFPSSIDQILHSFPEVVEYRTTASRQGELDHLCVEVEDRLDEPSRISQELQLRLGLKIEVKTVPLGSLPRFEGKGQRFVDQRTVNETVD